MSSALISYHRQDSAAFGWFGGIAFHMPPRPPFCNAIDRSVCHAKRAGNLAHPHVPLRQYRFDSLYVLRGQFGPAVFVAVGASAFLLHVFHVFRMRAQEQMLRIHASPDVALVAHHQARRNLPAKKLPCQPMC